MSAFLDALGGQQRGGNTVELSRSAEAVAATSESPFTAGAVISPVFSALAKFHQYRNKAAQLEVEAAFEGLRAKSEFAAAQQQSATINAATAHAMATAYNNFANSGIEVGGGGTVTYVGDTISFEGGSAAKSALLAGDIAKMTRRLNQRNLLIAAKNARQMAPIAAIGSFIGDIMKLAPGFGGGN